MRRAELQDGTLRLSFNYNEKMVAFIKERFRYYYREWDPDAKVWSVELNEETAHGLLEFLENWMPDSPALEEVCKEAGVVYEKINYIKGRDYHLSHSDSGEIVVPDLVGTPKPYQQAGMIYMTRKLRSFNADEMGLGKGVQAIGSIKILNAFPTLYITKASLKENMCREWRKWLPKIRVTHDLEEFVRAYRRDEPLDVLVTNYEQLWRKEELLSSVKWKGVVADESQKIAGSKSKQTKAAKQINRKTNPFARFALTGTPIDSKPIQLWSQMEWLGIDKEFGNWQDFVVRYCEGFKGSWGWSTDGASNTIELYYRLRNIGFIRRRKADVLKDLPAKTVVPIYVELDNLKEYRKVEREILDEIEEGNETANLQRLQRLLNVTARGKMSAFAEWAEDFAATGKKLISFAYNRAVQREAYEVLKQCGKAVYTMEGKPQDAVDAFQDRADVWAIQCSLEADHAGHTLTAASGVAFLQIGFLPSVIDQAGDRAHRIGQTDNVTCYVFIASGTVDEEVWDLHVEKRAVASAVADGKMAIPDVKASDVLRKLRG